MGKILRALGLMSGTSMDGIDVAYLETDGDGHVVRGPAATFPYDAEMRDMLRTALLQARDLRSKAERPAALAVAESELTERHAAAVSAFLRRTGIKRETIDVIGFHGHTVVHRPADQLSVQIGDGQSLADLSRCRVVWDMRANDIKAGGQGAPLVPVYHRALTDKLPQAPIAVVNIGGVANVSWIGRDGRLVAFDTGPGNALIDDFMLRRTGAAQDDGGSTAQRGKVHDDILHAYLGETYFAACPPKSLDRNDFAAGRVEALSVEDGAATLAALTAASIAKAREHMPSEPALWIVTGGGRRNAFVMRQLAERVENAVVPAETAGLDGDSLEAEAWAYLAVRSLHGLPISFPGTTGVDAPTTGGVVAKPRWTERPNATT